MKRTFLDLKLGLTNSILQEKGSTNSEDKAKQARDCPLSTDSVNKLLASPGQAEKHFPLECWVSSLLFKHTPTHILFTLPNEKPQQMESLGSQDLRLRRCTSLKGGLAGTGWGREK